MYLYIYVYIFLLSISTYTHTLFLSIVPSGGLQVHSAEVAERGEAAGLESLGPPCAMTLFRLQVHSSAPLNRNRDVDIWPCLHIGGIL